MSNEDRRKLKQAVKQEELRGSVGSANMLSSLSPLKKKEKQGQSSSGGDGLENSKHPSGDG